MLKKNRILIYLSILLSSLSFSQTFTNNFTQNSNSWNSGGSWNNALTRIISVSNLPTTLTTTSTVLKQINLKLGNGTAVNLTSYSIRLKSPNGTIISIISPGQFNATSAKNVDIKYRDESVLQFPSSSNQDPFNIGYYRTTDANSFSTLVGENPNGDWILEIIENTFSEVAFVSFDLVFGSSIIINDITGSNLNDNCSTPQCMGENTVVKATISGYTPEIIDPNTSIPFPGSCSWNGASNNTAWFIFAPITTSAKITISGITNIIQTLVINELNACVQNNQTVPFGGCPLDLINDTYTFPRYNPNSGSSSNEQFNLSDLVPGNKYLLIIDGNEGSVSNLYIELSGGLIELCCSTIIAGPNELCADSSPVLYSQSGGTQNGTWSVSPNSAGNIDSFGYFTPSNLTTNLSASISYDDGVCTQTFPITINALPNSGNSSSISFCSNADPLDLFSALSGSPSLSGSWSGPSILTSGYLGTYDPSTFTPGVYTYSVASTACVTATSTVTISETPLPNAGINDSIVLCSNSDPVNLFLQLTGNPDSTGTWSGNSILLGNHLGTYDAVTMNPGVYTYSVLANGACTTLTKAQL